MSTRYFPAKDATGDLVSGLSPSFSLFINADGSTILFAPVISEIGTTGVYKFSYEPDQDVVFQIDLDPPGSGGVVNRLQEDVLSPDDEAVTELRLATIWSAATKKWTRIKSPTFTATGKLDSATLAFYGSESDAAADANPILEVALGATYDGDDLLSEFVGLEIP